MRGDLLPAHLCCYAFGGGTIMFADYVRRAPQGWSCHAMPRRAPPRSGSPTAPHCSGARAAGVPPGSVYLAYTPAATPHHAPRVPVHDRGHHTRSRWRGWCAPSRARHLRERERRRGDLKALLPAFVSTNDALTARLWRWVLPAETPDPAAVSGPRHEAVEATRHMRRLSAHRAQTTRPSRKELLKF